MYMKKITYPQLERRWYCCPKCGTKLAIYDNTSKCTGVFVKCRTCRNEIEIRIKAL